MTESKSGDVMGPRMQSMQRSLISDKDPWKFSEKWKGGQSYLVEKSQKISPFLVSVSPTRPLDKRMDYICLDQFCVSESGIMPSTQHMLDKYLLME